MTPLALTDQQFTALMGAAAQLHPLDREPFLRHGSGRIPWGHFRDAENGPSTRDV
jgi:hypothetical protein